ncbi:hypothetical protein [Methanomassiliicoccus luminyensis]|uniref:hypothetical protein n=1 Tax=Methanomassiliicoccus luminyensis TaxID=1080712 RepID=UPI001F456761|nr:hypothetical protein [Methanomassiliicoccus luminyensis]
MACLITFGAFAIGWLVSYAASRWVFRRSASRMKALEDRLRTEDPRNMVLWRKQMHGYFFGFIHFFWIVFILLFELSIIFGGTDPWTDGTMRDLPTFTLCFTIVVVTLAPLQSLESGFSVVVANDEGIRQLRPGLRGYKEKAKIPWDSVVSVDYYGGSNQIAGIAIAGSGQAINVRLDSDNFDPLCALLMSKVPRDSFSVPAYNYCRIYVN